MRNLLKLTVRVDEVNIKLISDMATLYAEQYGATRTQISDIATSVKEAVSNIVLWADKKLSGGEQFYVEFAEEDGMFYCYIRDFGKGIKDLEKAKQPFYTTDPSEERSGMGLTIMQTFMDKFEIKSETSGANQGTVINMWKKLG